MNEIIGLLKSLIATPSFSKEEGRAADIVREFIHDKEISFQTKMNNTWCRNRYFSAGKPTILLNSHIDTVLPVAGWTEDPFIPFEDGDKLTGLGSNDAGGPLVALLATFLYFNSKKNLPYNLIFSATAEEENSGPDGVESILCELPRIDLAIVGEPTRMELAIAEKGLLVLDCTAKGKSGHAAREEGINALYQAIDDIQKLRNYRFEKKSQILGPVKITVTQIGAGTQHNVIPDTCSFVADLRTNEFYSNEEAFHIIRELIVSEVKPRSFRLNSSSIPFSHPLAIKAQQLGIKCFGSPTTSDQAVIPCPSVKIGPGDSARSHAANEYIFKSEIIQGIELYKKLLSGFKI